MCKIQGKVLLFGVLRPQTPDPLLSASNKSRQKRLSAHFAISNNTPLRSVLAKFEAEPNFFKIKNDSKEPKNFSFVRFFEITDINMLKLYHRIGCNDSPYSLVNQQTESMTEKFFKKDLLVTFVSLDKSNPPEAK